MTLHAKYPRESQCWSDAKLQHLIAFTVVTLNQMVQPYSLMY